MKKNFILSTAAVAAMAMAMTSCNCGVPQAKFNSQLDSVAYALGVLNGDGFAGIAEEGAVFPEVTIDLDNVLAGFLTAVRKDSSSLKISVAEAQVLLQSFQQKVQREQMEKQQARVAEEKAKGAEFMAKNSTADGVVTTESGLQIQTLVKGTGKTPKEGDDVKVNYKGTLLDGTVFDENKDVKFSTRKGALIEGFTEGLLSMSEGDKVILTIPSDLGYKDRGAGANIPGGATLQFEVELLEVIPVKK